MHTKSQVRTVSMFCFLMWSVLSMGNARAQEIYKLKWVTVDGHNIPFIHVAFQDGKPHLFMLDTAAPNTLMDRKVAAELHLDGTRVNPNDPRDYVSCLANLGPDGISIPDVPFVLADLSVLRKTYPGVEGILGLNVLKYFSMQLDYAKKQINLIVGSIKGTPNEPTSAVKLPFSESQDVYTLAGSIDKVKINFRLDTASEYTFVHEPTILQSLHPRTVLGDFQVGMVAESGVDARIVTAHLMKMGELMIGKLTFQNPIVQRDGSVAIASGLGNDILQRFHVLIDFPALSLYLTPDPDYKESSKLPLFITRPLQKTDISARPTPPVPTPQHPLEADAPAALSVVPFKTFPPSRIPLVSVSLDGGPPHLFMIDPGTSGGCLDRAFVQSAKFKLQKIKVEGSEEADVLVPARMTLQASKPLSIEKPVFFIMDLSSYRTIAPGMVGILGADLLGRWIERFDFSKQKIAFYPRETINLPDEQVYPAISLQATTGYALRAEIDGKPAPFEVSFTDDITRLQESVLLSGLKPIAKVQVVHADGRRGEQILRMQSLSVQNALWSHPVFDYSASPAAKKNILGLDFFSRFYVTLDLTSRQLYLEPDPKHTEDSTITMGMGFNVQAYAANKLRVEGFVVPSFAAQSGLKVGDEILELNGLPTATTPLRTLYNSIKRVEGTPITLIIRRKGEKQPRKFHLKISKLL